MKPSPTRYSADVELWLLLNGRRLNVSHLWHEGFILRETIEHPPTEAELIVCIDGHEDRRRVYLPDGLGLGQPGVSRNEAKMMKENNEVDRVGGFVVESQVSVKAGE